MDEPQRVGRHPGGLLFACCLTGLLLGMVLSAAGFNADARTVPLVIGVPALLVASLQTSREFRAFSREPRWQGHRRGIGRIRPLGTRVTPEGSSITEIDDRWPEAAGSPASVATAGVPSAAGLLWVAGLVALVGVFGILVAAPMFTAAYMRSVGRERWIAVVALSAGTPVVLHLLFTWLLDVELYRGMVGGWMPS